jgi:acyl carrier protein
MAFNSAATRVDPDSAASYPQAHARAPVAQRQVMHRDAQAFSLQDIQARIIPFLADLSPDWEFDDWDDKVDAQTQLIADLGLTSVEFIDLFVAIEKDFGRTIGFHDLLMVEGRYIEDLRLGELSRFVWQRLTEDAWAPAAVEGFSAEALGEPRTMTVPATPVGESQAFTQPLDAAMLARFTAIIPRPSALIPPAARNPRAVFLLSAPRSGSTLLQAILAGHSRLFAPPELHLLWFRDLAERRAAFVYDGNRHLTSGAIRALMALDGLTPEAATARMEGYESRHLPISAFYHRLQERLGSRLLVDKTPANAYSREVLERAELLFEEPLYLHLVRHPGGMTRSFIDAKLERTVPFMQRHAQAFTTEEFAELAWLSCNDNIAEVLAGIPAGRQFRLHYEDLVSAPERVLGAVCAFLGLEVESAMLDPYAEHEGRMVDGVNRVGDFSGDLKFHLHGRIQAEAAWRWQRFDNGRGLSEMTWRLAERLGYQRGG